jgi:hypothetical protein
MSINFPDKAKGVPYTNTETTSASIINPYDTFVDFENDVVIVAYGSEYKRKVSRSIITFMQEVEPDPTSDAVDYGDIWVKPSTGVLKVFRSTNTWELWQTHNTDNAFSLTQNDNIQPTIAGADALFEEDINGDLQETGVVVDNNLFESDAGEITIKI